MSPHWQRANYNRRGPEEVVPWPKEAIVRIGIAVVEIADEYSEEGEIFRYSYCPQKPKPIPEWREKQWIRIC